MYDYIVVGAGSAGCVVASRLSEDPGVRVLLLEAGPADDRVEVRIPAAFGKLFKTDMDWAYETEPEEHLRGRRLFWPRGRMLGGSSSMNAMVWARGHPADYDEWRALGNTGWSWDDVLPVFRRIERCGRGPADHRGCEGPVHVTDLRDPNPATRAFVEAARQAGIPRSTDINGPGNDGVDFTQVTQRRGSRWSAADAYLRPTRRRRNLHVLTGAQATRILMEGLRAAGVQYMIGGRTEEARARLEVVVAAGTVNTPHLLMLSGIGPAAALRQAGVAPLHDLPGVGANLQDHLLAGLIVRCPLPISLVAAESKANLLRYFVMRRGMLTSNVAEALAFLRSEPDLPAPDYELVFAPVPYIDHGLVRPPGHGLSIGVVLLRPASRGRIRLRSADPLLPPAIEANYLSDAAGHDIAVMRVGMRTAVRIFGMPALRAFVGDCLEPARLPETDEELDAHIREQAETLYHPVGTCRMGPGPDAVVDAQLRVHGIAGLRIADASVMPVIVRGHTHAATLMIGEKAAAMMRAALPATVPAVVAPAMATPRLAPS